jgi:hypothetical protein
MAIQLADRTKLWLTGLGVTAASVVAFAIEDRRQLDFRWQLATFVAVVSIAFGFYHYRAMARKPMLIVYYVASLLALLAIFYLLSLLPEY